MWKLNIILLAVVVACSAGKTDKLNAISKSILDNWDSPEENTSETTDVSGKIIQECEIESNEVGRCVKKSLCSAAIPTADPLSAFTIRTLGNGGSVFSTKRNADTSNEKQCGWMEVCCPTNNIITPTSKAPSPALGCGYSNPGAMRGFDGKAASAEYADFPWMVALMVKSNKPAPTFTDEYIGGGTIIHPTVVMTVAHKVASITDPTSLKCRAGEWNWEIRKELYAHQDRDVARIIVHEQFDRVYMYYDVALLKLKSAFDFTNAPHIGVACLEKTLPPANTVCYSMGWGKDITNNENNAKILKKLTLPLVAGDVCEELFRPQLSWRYKLHKTLTCAGGEAGVDTCVGDGGSPLVCPIPDKTRLRYSVVGMVAYGLGCGEENKPGAYAKVPELYGWVTKQMKMTLNIDENTFGY